MSRRFYRPIGSAVLVLLFLAFSTLRTIPNEQQALLAEATADNLLGQSQRHVQDLESVGQGFGRGELKELETVSAQYGDIVDYRRTGSHRSPRHVAVDYEVRRTRALTHERIELRAGYTRSYSRDFADVERTEVLSAAPLR